MPAGLLVDRGLDAEAPLARPLADVIRDIKVVEDELTAERTQRVNAEADRDSYKRVLVEALRKIYEAQRENRGLRAINERHRNLIRNYLVDAPVERRPM